MSAEEKEEKKEPASSDVTDKLDESGCLKEDGIKEIGVFMTVYRISDIDTQKQTFSAQIELQLTWLPSKEDIENFKNDADNYKPTYIPKYTWDNSEDVNMEMDDAGYELMENGGIDLWGNEVELCVPFTNAVVYNVAAKFVVPNMHLGNFPFDVIDLPMQMECQQTVEKVIFVPSLDVGNSVVEIDKNCGKLNPEYKIHTPVVEMCTNVHDGELYSAFIVHLKFERFWVIYFNIFLTLFALCICTLSVFLLDHADNLNDRISNIFTILLTIVAYQFILQSDLPNLPYNTKADLYILSCFAYLIIITVHAIIANIVDREDYDQYGFWAIAIGFLLFNVYFIALTTWAKRYDLKKLKWLQKDYDALHEGKKVGGDDDNDDDDDDGDEDEEEDDENCVFHPNCYFNKPIRERLGNYWPEYLEKKNGDDKEDKADKGDKGDKGDSAEAATNLEEQIELNKES